MYQVLHALILKTKTESYISESKSLSIWKFLPEPLSPRLSLYFSRCLGNKLQNGILLRNNYKFYFG